jgi:hypothetical protein
MTFNFYFLNDKQSPIGLRCSVTAPARSQLRVDKVNGVLLFYGSRLYGQSHDFRVGR